MPPEELSPPNLIPTLLSHKAKKGRGGGGGAVFVWSCVSSTGILFQLVCGVESIIFIFYFFSLFTNRGTYRYNDMFSISHL